MPPAICTKLFCDVIFLQQCPARADLDNPNYGCSSEASSTTSFSYIFTFFFDFFPSTSNYAQILLIWNYLTLDLRTSKDRGKQLSYCLGFHSLESLDFPHWNRKNQDLSNIRRRKGRFVLVLDFRIPISQVKVVPHIFFLCLPDSPRTWVLRPKPHS